jgi:phosphatidylglycerophosphatase A
MSAGDGPLPHTGTPSPTRRLLSTACGIGLLPIAPGTWASAATALAFALVFGVRGILKSANFADASAWSSPWVLRGAVLGALLVILAGGIWLGNRAGRDFGVSDPGPFVLDEVVGQGLALLPLLPGPMPGWSVLAAFALFRLFDIWKPPPCAALELLPGGLGIMADDVMAGLYAAAIVAVLPV